MNSSEQLLSHDKRSPSWLIFGQDGETESMLLGNAAGLETLRRAIDQALQSGEGEIDVDVSDLTAVRCASRMPVEKLPSGGGCWGVYGCFAILVVFAVLAAFGFLSLVQLGLGIR